MLKINRSTIDFKHLKNMNRYLFIQREIFTARAFDIFALIRCVACNQDIIIRADYFQNDTGWDV